MGMIDPYRLAPTSASTTDTIDRVLSESDHGLNRRIARLQIVDNIHDPEARVKATLMLQKRHSKKEEWRDADSFSGANLRAGQEVRIQLDCAETQALLRELEHLRELGRRGIPRQPQTYAVVEVSDKNKEAVLALIERVGKELWSLLAELRPKELEALADARHHARRREAVELFRAQMAAREWDEDEWEEFFATNVWIFGHGLAYQFVRMLERQAYVGGKGLDGRGGHVVDWMAHTEARAKFTVLVDIKLPESRLIGPKYRNRAYPVSGELSGAVAQLLVNCQSWVTEGAQQRHTRDDLQRLGVETYEPRGILVCGDMAELDDADKRASYELFRRNLRNPEILTYDELLRRAEYLVSYEETPQAPAPPEPTDGVPF